MNVLVVEDNDVDVEHIARCLARSELPNEVYHALDGEEALTQLRGTTEAGPLDRPYLVVLDLNMPRMNGLEFLEELRSEPELADTPVLVLTTSDSEEDIRQSMQLGAVGYLTKPISSEQLARVVVEFDAKQQARTADERTYSIAVVNSDDVFTSAVRESSRATGWSFRFFDTASEALPVLAGRLPDIVVFDQQLDSPSGMTLLEELIGSPGAAATRFFLSSPQPIPADVAERVHALGVRTIDAEDLLDRDRLLEFLES